jgi:hypothetical protein
VGSRLHGDVKEKAPTTGQDNGGFQFLRRNKLWESYKAIISYNPPNANTPTTPLHSDT